jgi:hypothetical protein
MGEKKHEEGPMLGLAGKGVGTFGWGDPLYAFVAVHCSGMKFMGRKCLL